MVSLENVEKTSAVLCFRSQVLNSLWFYHVFARKYWEKNKKNCWLIVCSLASVKKTNGFIMFSLEHIEKQCVSCSFRSRVLNNQWFYYVFIQKHVKSKWFYVVFGPKPL